MGYSGRMGVVACVCAAVFSVSALAAPRDSATGTNVISDSRSLTVSAGTLNLNPVTSYSVEYITLRGQLTKLNTATWASDAVILVYRSQVLLGVMSPLTEIGTPTNAVPLNYVFKLQEPVLSDESWTFVMLDTYDDAGQDARWDTVTVTLNDGEPQVPTGLVISPTPNAVDVLGNVPAPGRTLKNQVMAPGSARWYRIDVPFPVSTTGAPPFTFAGYLDIDTIGSTIDTVIALYDEDGRVVSINDQSGGNNASLLSYGTAPARPPIGLSFAFSNQNGTLRPGTYFLCVTTFPTGGFSTGWQYSSTGSGGTFQLNIRTNISVSAPCVGDANQDGDVSVPDIFAFLSRWFAGC